MSDIKKIYIAFADRDEAYLKAISNYLLIQRLNNVQVMFATGEGYLKQLLEDQEKPFDLLLIHPDMLNSGIDFKRAAATVLLSETSTNPLTKDFKCIGKYQAADKLINQLLELISEAIPEATAASIDLHKGTRTILFYSPAGGSGTTVACMAAAMVTAKLGKRVLYLSLENIPSQQLLLASQGNSSSRLYYALKKKDSSLLLKLEALRLVDSSSGLHYLAPPDSLLDLEELEIGDISQLLQSLRSVKAYEFVFVDISSHFNSRCKFLLETCDLITLVISNSRASSAKARLLERELISNNLAAAVRKKLTVIQNYVQPLAFEKVCSRYSFLDTGVEFRLPIEEELFVLRDQVLRLNLDNGYGNGISQYVSQLINRNKRDEGLWKSKE